MWNCPDFPFEWDNAKRLSNLSKHGIDFWDVIKIFDEPFVESPSISPGEERWKAVGCCHDVLIAVVYTIREGRRRIISARPAKKNERAQYYAHHPP